MNDKMLDKLVSCDVSGVDLKTVEPRSFVKAVCRERQPSTSRSP